MKTAPLYLTALLLSLAACNKDDDSEPDNYGTFTVAGTTYVATDFEKNTTSRTISASDSKENTISFTFTVLPTASGTYAIVGAPDTTGEVSINVVLADNSSSTYYTYNFGTTASITVTEGKTSISIPETRFFGYNVSDSVQIQAAIVER